MMGIRALTKYLSGFLFRALIFTTPLAAVSIDESWAGPAFYADAGVGGSQIHAPSPFWGTGLDSSSLGYAVNYGVWTTFSTNEPALNLQFGIQDRYASATSSGNTLGLNAIYPELRLQLSRIYFTGGLSPLVMKSFSGNGASTSLSHVSGAISYLGEVGILFPITPKVSFGLSAAAEYVHLDSESSPKPLASASAFLRFYFGFGDGSHNSSEFHGWRYPFGQGM